MIGRNIMGGIFPLIDGFMFRHLTFEGASSLLGGVVSPHIHISLTAPCINFPAGIIESIADPLSRVHS